MKKVDFIPAEQRVLVLPDDKSENKTKTGLILPTSVDEEKPFTGTIISVGTGSEVYPMKYGVGDKVLFSSYAGVETVFNHINHGRKEFKVMNQIDIMGRIVEIEEE